MKVYKITAATRRNLINKSLAVAKGRQRYYRRLFSEIIISDDLIVTSVDEWFKTDVLQVRIKIDGETDKYYVFISFFGVWNNYDKRRELSKLNISDAIWRAWQAEDIYVYCDCPDFHYRFGYVATKGRYISKNPEYRPAKKTNPNDKLGGACKHVMLCLVQSHKWISRLSQVTYSYIKRIKKDRSDLYDNVIKSWIEQEADGNGVNRINSPRWEDVVVF